MRKEQRITMRKFDDWHQHLRDEARLRLILRFLLSWCARGLVMPNDPKIFTAQNAMSYSHKIMGSALREGHIFTPLMSLYLNGDTTSEILREAKEQGVVAGKVYPEGVTTGSEGGVADIRSLYPIFEEMERLELVLCLHGEVTYGDPLFREKEFIPELRRIAHTFRKLRIVLEHVSSKAGVEAVQVLPETVAATVTAHHLYLTHEDVVGGKLRPHNYCAPIAKFPEDRKRIREALLSGSERIRRKYFFGSDMALHTRENKECAEGCAGVFSTLAAPGLVLQFFDGAEKLEYSEDFTSRWGAEFYGKSLNEEMVTFVKRPSTVPLLSERDGVEAVPFWAGKEIDWQVE